VKMPVKSRMYPTVEFHADRPSVESLREFIKSYGAISQIEMIRYPDPDLGRMQVFAICNRRMAEREIFTFFKRGLREAAEARQEARQEDPQADWVCIIVGEDPVDDRGYSCIVGIHVAAVDS